MSNRKVISEAEILAVRCPRCDSPTTCRDKDRIILAGPIGSTELTFHRERIIEAVKRQLTNRMRGPLSPTDKALIVYYAFIMLCDSLSTKSKEFIGKELSSEELQAFFAHQAIEELRKDKLIV